MKVIGKRSAGELIIALILSAVVLPLFIMLSVLALTSTMEGNQNITLMTGGLFTVLCLMYLITTASRPKELIRYDNDHFYLIYRTKTKTIPISSIVGITPRAARAKGVRYSFGKIIVRTNHGRYAIDGVANVEEVAIEMTLIKEEHRLREHDL
jgi:hypothetical protein